MILRSLPVAAKIPWCLLRRVVPELAHVAVPRLDRRAILKCQAGQVRLLVGYCGTKKRYLHRLTTTHDGLASLQFEPLKIDLFT